jgi:hypothetical protein
MKTISQTKEEVNFWTNKTPCWESCHCPQMIQNDCPAPKYQFIPCWEIEGTYCKLNDFGATGKDTSICEVCRVYKKYGKNLPIEIKLLGRGINNKLANINDAFDKTQKK